MEQRFVIQRHKVVGLPLAPQILSCSDALSIPRSVTPLFPIPDVSVSPSPMPADHTRLYHCDIHSSLGRYLIVPTFRGEDGYQSAELEIRAGISLSRT